MSDLDYVRLSKTVSHALRHDPALYGLALDEEGWTAVDGLLEGLRRHRRQWRTLSRADLEAMMSRPGKKRFEIENDRIRALYGHSVPTQPDKEAATPPRHLYHGTAPATVRLIQTNGLQAMNRQYVHLSSDRPTAYEVGRRKAVRPAILRIRAEEAHEAGVTFYRAGETIWLADAVPARFIEEIY